MILQRLHEANHGHYRHRASSPDTAAAYARTGIEAAADLTRWLDSGGCTPAEYNSREVTSIRNHLRDWLTSYDMHRAEESWDT